MAQSTSQNRPTSRYLSTVLPKAINRVDNEEAVSTVVRAVGNVAFEIPRTPDYQMVGPPCGGQARRLRVCVRHQSLSVSVVLSVSELEEDNSTQ